MTNNNISVKNIDKDFSIINIDDILSIFVDSNEACKECGCDHSFRPTFKNTKTSIDVIRSLFQVERSEDF